VLAGADLCALLCAPHTRCASSASGARVSASHVATRRRDRCRPLLRSVDRVAVVCRSACLRAVCGMLRRDSCEPSGAHPLNPVDATLNRL
jgi:hypothetical protein